MYLQLKESFGSKVRSSLLSYKFHKWVEASDPDHPKPWSLTSCFPRSYNVSGTALAPKMQSQQSAGPCHPGSGQPVGEQRIQDGALQCVHWEARLSLRGCGAQAYRRAQGPIRGTWGVGSEG